VALDVTDDVSDGAKIQPQFVQEKSPTRGGQTDKQPNTEGQYGNQNISNQGQQQKAGSNSSQKSGKQGSATK
jgi:hypothetical protein